MVGCSWQRQAVNNCKHSIAVTTKGCGKSTYGRVSTSALNGRMTMKTAVFILRPTLVCIFVFLKAIYIYICCNVLDAMSTSICSLNICSNSATMNAPKTLLGAKGPPRTYRTDCTIQDATMFPPANEFHSGSRWKVVSMLEAKKRKLQSNAGIKERENPLLAYEKQLEGTDKHQRHHDLFT